jgi:uroporphyrinogen III methyltransferase / synthase
MSELMLMVGTEIRFRLKRELESFQLATWPAFRIHPPESYAGLDEAIGNLYGYDWIIFVNAGAVRAFLERLDAKGQNVSDLDSLGVCAIGEATTEALEHAQVHVDLTTRRLKAVSIVEELKSFAGGDDALNRLNFLIPRAAIGRDYLTHQIEDAGARVDVVPAYQTVSTDELTRLSALQSMLRTGSVDAVLFGRASDVNEFIRVFDMSDLGPLVKGTPVLTIGDDTSSAAIAFGVPEPIQVSAPFSISIREALSQNAGSDFK